MKRMALTPDEVTFIERLRAERAIYNGAIADVMAKVSGLLYLDEDTVKGLLEEINVLRKEG